MALRFRAKPGHTVLRPGAQLPGQPPVIIGMERDETGGYVPMKEPFECEDDSPIGMRLRKLVAREESLDPCDEHTASLCGQVWVAPKGKKDGDK